MTRLPLSGPTEDMGPVVSERTPITLGTILALGALVVTGIMGVATTASRLSTLEAAQSRIELQQQDQVKAVEKVNARVDETLKSIDSKIDGLRDKIDGIRDQLLSAERRR